MFTRFLIALVAALTMTVSVAPEAYAWNLGSRSRLLTVETAAAPLAFQPFCVDYPSECRKSRRTIMAYTAKVRTLLVLASVRINLVTAPRATAVRTCRDEFQGWSNERFKKFV
ncbi:MAG: hypothetical protein JWL86_5643 [Rhizobium sp.]|nr:hypothetical protein [Rhizobium sp.]